MSKVQIASLVISGLAISVAGSAIGITIHNMYAASGVAIKTVYHPGLIYLVGVSMSTTALFTSLFPYVWKKNGMSQPMALMGNIRQFGLDLLQNFGTLAIGLVGYAIAINCLHHNLSAQTILVASTAIIGNALLSGWRQYMLPDNEKRDKQVLGLKITAETLGVGILTTGAFAAATMLPTLFESGMSAASTSAMQWLTITTIVVPALMLTQCMMDLVRSSYQASK